MFKGAPILNAQQINEILNLDPLVINASGRIATSEDNIDDIVSEWNKELCEIEYDIIHEEII